MVDEFCAELLKRFQKIHDVGSKLKKAAYILKWRPTFYDGDCFKEAIAGC